MTWALEANCRHIPKTVFFPTPPKPGGDHTGVYRTAVTAAQAVCDGCPVQLRCYADAVNAHQTEGIWGGVDFNGRPPGKINTPARCGTDGGYKRHRYYNETACPECKAAHVTANQQRRTTRAQ